MATDPLTDHKVVRRITALLKLAGNNPNEHEAAAAAAKAQDLMLEHNIDLARIASESAADAAVNAGFQVDHVKIVCDTGPSSNANWRTLIGHHLAQSVGGRCVISSNSGSRSHGTFQMGKLIFFAPRDTLQSLVETFVWLDLQLTTRSADETKTRPNGEQARAFRSSWLFGAATVVCERLDEALRLREQDKSTGTALIHLRDHVSDAVSEAFPLLDEAVSRDAGGSQAGYSAGRVAGSQADLGSPSVSGGSRTQIGSAA